MKIDIRVDVSITSTKTQTYRGYVPEELNGKELVEYIMANGELQNSDFTDYRITLIGE